MFIKCYIGRFIVTHRERERNSVDKVQKLQCYKRKVKEALLQVLGLFFFPKLKIFVEMFCVNLQSSVWSRHAGDYLWSTNMAAGNSEEHLELTLAI